MKAVLEVRLVGESGRGMGAGDARRCEKKLWSSESLEPCFCVDESDGAFACSRDGGAIHPADRAAERGAGTEAEENKKAGQAMRRESGRVRVLCREIA